MDLKNRKLVLASGSPRRKDLLTTAGLQFIVRKKDIDESYPDTLTVDKISEYLAVKKAEVQKLENDETELNMKIISLVENVNVQQKTIDLLEKEKAIKENDLKFLQTQIKLQRENMKLQISDGNDDISESLDAELDVDQQE